MGISAGPSVEELGARVGRQNSGCVDCGRKSADSVFFLSGCCMAQRKVVVRAVALLSAKTKLRVANSLEKFFPKKQQT